MSHSQFHCTGRAYLDMHGLIFETSICYWQIGDHCNIQYKAINFLRNLRSTKRDHFLNVRFSKNRNTRGGTPPSLWWLVGESQPALLVPQTRAGSCKRPGGRRSVLFLPSSGEAPGRTGEHLFFSPPGGLGSAGSQGRRFSDTRYDRPLEHTPPLLPGRRFRH